MSHSNRFKVIANVVLLLPACQRRSQTRFSFQSAHVEQIDGSDFVRVTLTQQAIDSIGLQTTAVKERQGSPTAKTVPYSSLIYDTHGGTWVYTNHSPRVFVRQEVKVARIEGDDVLLLEGPDVGTVIVSAGVAELYGSEFGLDQ